MDGFSIVVLSTIGVVVGAVTLVVLLLRSNSKEIQRKAWQRERKFEGNVNLRAQAFNERMRREERERRQAEARNGRAAREKSRKEQKAKSMF